jgi:dTMP kinase
MIAWVSVEGLNGVGKTHLVRQLAARLGDDCDVANELTDHPASKLAGKVIAALASDGDTFLRTGHPLTETLALLALKVLEFERRRDHDVALVIEDRGHRRGLPGAILAADARFLRDRPALRILAETTAWRPLPNRTLLLVDNIDTCIRRFGSRLQRPVRADEHRLLHRVHALYTALAAAHPDRIRIIDRVGRSRTVVLDQLQVHCRAVLAEVRAP